MEPIIKRVESSLRCLTLVCYMTPSLVEHEVEGLGYAETAGASASNELLADCLKSAKTIPSAVCWSLPSTATQAEPDHL